MIGRSDYQLLAPPLPDLPERVISVCRRRWPHGVFLDADETELIPLSSLKLAWRPPSREFFVFSDRATADTWDDLGPCPENWNRMLHFLWKPDRAGSSVPMTVVIDELTPDIQSLLDDLQATFREADYFAPHAAEAA
jgi:hypothetical protein